MYSFTEILDNISRVNIMHIQLNISTEIEINKLTDLPKLKLLTESSHMKINKSQLAREFGVDRRTIDKYLNGYTVSKKRNKGSKMINSMMRFNPYYPMNPSNNSIIKELAVFKR